LHRISYMKTSITPMFAATEAQLVQLGERLRLARLRRGIGVDALAASAGLSRVTVFRVEKGASSVAMGAYARVMETLGLAADLDLVAQQDAAGRRLQDELLAPRRYRAQPASRREFEVLRESPEAIWEFKRRNQRQDIAAIHGERATNAAMSWFTEEQATRAEVVGEPL
jgi:transcriptional regulator with XRE-family HTH domain